MEKTKHRPFNNTPTNLDHKLSSTFASISEDYSIYQINRESGTAKNIYNISLIPNQKLEISTNEGSIAVRDNKILYAYMFKHEIDQILPNGQTKTWTFSKGNPPVIVKGLVNELESKVHFIDLRATNQFVYALYVGRTGAETRRTNGIGLKNKLQVIDWEGNLKKQYELDQPIRWFDIDEKRGLLVGINELSEEEPLVRYALR